MSENRREFERLGSIISISYQIIERITTDGKKVLSHPVQTAAKDFSVGGVKLLSRNPVATRTPLEVTVNLPHFRAPIVTEGVVTRCRKLDDRNWELGFRFENLRPADKARIERFIELAHEDLITHNAEEEG